MRRLQPAAAVLWAAVSAAACAPAVESPAPEASEEALTAGPAATAAAPERPARRASIPVGERLVYGVKVKGIPAGQAVLAVEKVLPKGKKKAYRISLSVKSNRFARLFKPIDDRAVSLVETETLHSLGYEARKREGARFTHEVITPDYEAKKARTLKERTGAEPRERELELPGEVQDAVSWFYALRAMDFDAEEPPGFTVATTSRVRELKLRKVRKVAFNVRGHGRTETIEVTAADGGEALMGKEGSVTMWLEERTHVPVKVIVRSGRLSVGMYLARTSGSALDKAKE